MPLNQQTINIGSEPNDGTGDSVYVAFQKVNSNFTDIYTLLGFGAGFSFLRLKEAPSVLRPNAILQVNAEGNKFLNKILVPGEGINIDFLTSSTEIRIINTASSLKSDKNPTLAADLSGENAFSLINMDNTGPRADWDAVSRKWVYENFINRDGVTRYDNTSISETIYNGSSTIRSNVQLLIAPTSSTHLVNKGYVDNLVDNSGFASKQNFFVALTGDDHQYTLPSFKRGRAFAYAFKTLNRAAEAAEQFIAASQITLGPYQKTVTMSNGTAKPVLTSITTSTLLDPSSFGIRLRVTLDPASFNIGTDPFINKSIFPGNYILGARSEAIGLIEAITLDSVNGFEFYDITPVDYAKPYRMAVEPEPFSYSAYVTSGGEITEVAFLLDVADSIDIPDFWIGYKFVITNPSYGIKSYGYISKIIQELDEDQNVRDTIVVDFRDGLPLQDGDVIDYDRWHVYAADFELNEELIWGQKQNKNQCSIMVESGEYDDQYPIKVPENASIRGDEFRRCIIRPAPLFSTRLPGISDSKWANTYFYRDAQIDGIITTQLNTGTDYSIPASVVLSSTDNDPVSKTITVTLSAGVANSAWIGKIFKIDGSVNAQGEIRSVNANTFAVSLAQNEANFEKTAFNYTVGDALTYGSWHIYDPYKYGYHYLRDASRPINLLTTLNNSGGYNNASDIILRNKEFIKAECLGFLTTTFSTFVFDQGVYAEELDYIVDSLAYDIKNGGSNRTINAGDSWKKYNVVSTQTVATINHINTIGQRILINRPPVTSYQTAEEQYFSDPVGGTLVSSGSGVILADLVQACSRIVNNDPAFNPPKYNEEMDVFLMNDATINRYVSAQGHGGFMKVLDPDGQILAKSPYTQTASSFSKSKNRHVFSGGMFIDGFAGNTIVKVGSISTASGTGHPVIVNSALTTGSLGRPSVVPGEGYIRPQVPCFFIHRGVTYEVSFISNFDPINGTGKLNLNPLRAGGIASITSSTSIATGFRTGGTSITVPVRFGAPTQAGGLSSTGTAVINSAGAVQSVSVSFPGSGYVNGTFDRSNPNCPAVIIGGARISWRRNNAGGITGWEILDGGQGYAVGTTINFPSSGGATATATVNGVSGTGAITSINITSAGSGYQTDPAVTFGNGLNYTAVIRPGFIVTANHPTPSEVTLVTAGNRSMLANDFTQMNDLGYGIFCTNGGLVENVSMFTYYCYSAYYSLNGGQCRSVAGSTSYGLNGLKAEGSDPTEVPIAVRNKRTTSQIVTVNAIGTYTNRAEDATLYIDGVSYDPVAQSQIEINHNGTVVTYNVKSAVQDTFDSSVYSLSLDDGTGQGLRFAVPDGTPATLRLYFNQELLDVNAATLSRPSTVLTLSEDPTYVYRVLKYTDLGGDTALAESDTPYNYINLNPWTEANGLYRQGLGNIVITNPGAGFSSVTTQYPATIPAPSAAGTASVSATATDTDLISISGASGTIMVGSRVTLTSGGGDPNGVPTYVTWINATNTQIRVDRTWTWNNGVGLTFSGTQAVGYGLANSAGQITRVVLTNQGAGYATTASRSITITGGSSSATATANPVGIVGSNKIKVVDIDANNRARIDAGISRGYFYVFGFEGNLYRITDYASASETNNEWGEVTVERFSDGATLQHQVLSSGLKAGITSNQPGEITVRISTMRVSGHDMLNIGTGGYADSKYPNDLYGPPTNPPDTSLEVQEVGKGRVYSSTTDQDGNFKVGKFFSVDQGRGTVSISAPISLTNVDGISFKRGQTLVQVFSVDGTMGGNSNNSVPTERAIQTYVNSRLGLNRNNTAAGVSPIGNGFLDRGGVLEMLDTIKMGNNRIVNLADPVSGQDAVNRQWAEARYVNTSGDTMVGVLNMSNNNISSLADPVSGQDAVNRQWAEARYINTSGDTMVGVLNMSNNNISSLADPVSGQDAVNRQWAEARYINTSGDTMVGTLNSELVQPRTNLTYDLGGTSNRYVNVYGNRFWGTATTAESLNASITIELSGDVTGSASFNGSGSINIATTVSSNSVALGTDTTGNYVASMTAGNGITVGTATGEGSTPVITNTGVLSAVAGTGVSVSAATGDVTFSIGQAIGTGNSPTFAGVTLPSITKNGTDGTGDIGQSNNRFANVYGVAFQAKYADLAEKYLPDAHYEPGTVVVFGGSNEVTIAKEFMDRRVAGIVSTDPAYKMNSDQDGGIYIALQGRVPCKVVGNIKKGDMLIASGAPGVATSEKNPAMGSVIGKALQDYNGQTIGIIEVVVGRI
jgi:hypothetical protein